MSISRQSGARGLESLPSLKYNVLKQENRLISKGSMLSKIVIIWKKAWSKSCWEFNSLQKLSGRTCLSPTPVELGAPKIVIFEIF